MQDKFSYTVTKEDEAAGLSIRELMRRNFSFSARLRTKIKKNRTAFLDGEDIPVWVVPHAGSVISVQIPEEISYFEPEDIPIDIIYEDDDIIVLNKQAGITVHPTKGRPDHTIANAVAKYMLDSGQEFKLRFINRLDMDTSGVLLLGKNSFAQDDFVKQVKRGEVHKGYVALVHGLIDEEGGTIDAPLARLEDDIRRAVIPGGQESITHYEVIDRFSKNGKHYTLVRLELETGRTHQIRVHMSYIGHSIVGDPLYGGPDGRGDDSGLLTHQALHAYRLKFRQPVTRAELDLRAEMPEDMKALISSLK